MRCKECGAILLDTDTYCGKCGAKVELDVCPECGEVIRPGMRFCSNCGYEVKQESEVDNQPEDDEIPVIPQVKTVEIPFDIIEENIIRDVERQLDNRSSVSSSHRESTKSDRTVEKVVTDKKTAAPKKKIEVLPEYDDEYEESDYDDDEELYEEDSYEDDYEEDDYVDEDDEYVDEDDSDDSPSTFSRLITAGMIVVGLLLVLLIAMVFFRNRKSNVPENNDTEIIEQVDNTEVQDESQNSDGIIGSVVIIKNVNIRDLPTTDNSNVLGVAKEGETYSYYGYAEDSANWVHIKVDDETDGYVYKDYVEFQ